MQGTNLFRLFIIPFCILFWFSCGPKSEGKLSSPPGYNLEKPQIYKLPSGLDEISGIVYYPKDKSVLAINDERGWLYKVALSRPNENRKMEICRRSRF